MTTTHLGLLGICLLLPGLYLMQVGSREMTYRQARLAARARIPTPSTGHIPLDVQFRNARANADFEDGIAHSNALVRHRVGLGLVVGGCILLVGFLFGDKPRRCSA